MSRDKMESTGKRKWRKVLYENQGFPDNYVDSSFLDELKKNVHIRKYEYWSVVKESGVVTQQMSSICIFVIVYVYMSEHKLEPITLFITSSILALIGYICDDLVDRGQSRSGVGRTRKDDIKTALIFLSFSFGLSPVLVSLTESVSTDTIYAMTTIMLLANLCYHDYGANAAMVSGSLSLNAATFASVCLASRLHSPFHAFAIVTFALELFALWPVLRRKLKVHMHYSQVVMTLLMSLTASLLLATISLISLVIFSLIHAFITFVCPAWLISLQPIKNTIHGPWDEAVIST